VLAAVVQDGKALQYVSPELQGDREVVLAAVAQNVTGTVFRVSSAEGRSGGGADGFALKYASAELQGDREVALAAIAVNFMVLVTMLWTIHQKS